MKNIDKNNKISDIEDNSLNENELSNDDSVKKIGEEFDKQMDKLKDIAKKEIEEETKDELDGLKNINNKEIKDNLEKKVDDYFDKIDEEFGKIDPGCESNVVSKYKKIAKRDIDVQEAITKSGESVLDEISNWGKQKNPVAKSLLRIASWIMSTEK